MAQDQSPSPITVAPLPLLPHPSSLTSSPAFLIQEARRTYQQLSLLRQEVYSESSKYLLDPPGPSSLPPLPPIPLPPTTYRKASFHPLSSTSPRPNQTPPIHPSSPFASTNTIDECVPALKGIGVYVDKRYHGTALWIVFDRLSAWILLRPDTESTKMAVRVIRMFDTYEGDRPIHTQSTSAPLRALSKHLTELSLTLPELLFRLVALPKLLVEPCWYCKKHFRVPDGMPYTRTGLLAQPSSSTRHTRGDAEEEETGVGLWVSWHASCEPSS